MNRQSTTFVTNPKPFSFLKKTKRAGLLPPSPEKAKIKISGVSIVRLTCSGMSKGKR